jgi:hypothetical protein
MNTHFLVDVHHFLHENFPGKWFDHSGPHTQIRLFLDMCHFFGDSIPGRWIDRDDFHGHSIFNTFGFLAMGLRKGCCLGRTEQLRLGVTSFNLKDLLNRILTQLVYSWDCYESAHTGH